MAKAGIRGARRTKRVRTTRRDQSAGRHADLVQRQFSAPEPNRLWVTDLTFVATWAGVAYVCFIVDAFSRMIVGWRVASHMRTPMVLDAIEMARWSRGTHHDDLRCHSDAGSQFTSIRYGERLAESARSRQSAPSATRSTTPWPRPSTASTGRADPRPRPHRRVEDRRRRRACDARLGALAQHEAPARLPRRSPARGVRAELLRCPTGRQGPHPITRARASIRTRTVQSGRPTPLRGCNQKAGPPAKRRPNAVARPQSRDVITLAESRGGGCGRVLERGDVDLPHLQHRGHHALRRLRVGIVEQLLQPPRDDLPGHPEAVLEPAARALLAALAEPAPVFVDLLLRAAVDLERDRLVEGE